MSARQDKSLHDACAKGQSRKVREILQKNTDIANRLDLRIGFLGYTPLHEAACQGHDDILQLLLIYGGNVNAMANGNYTPLHIAASMDYVKCIKVLLKNGANIKALDDFNKTPYQTAIQHKRKDSAKCLKSAEIIQAAGKDSLELKDLLNETATKDITTSCFDDALIEACHRGQFDAACMLLVAGAKKVKECICISIRNGHYRISALLLLCYAALSGDVVSLEMLLDKSLDCYEWLQQFIDEAVPIGTVVEKIRESLKDMDDYTSIAIQLPGLGTPVIVLKNLLLNTSCRVREKKVNWSKLSLSKIDESWLVQLKSWVQYLNLSNNKLTSLPNSVVDLKMVVNLNLSKNKIKVVPVEVFSLISLRELNLSGNAIAELPEAPQWRPVLKSFNVSDNNLSSLPASIARSCIETLNLSGNNFIRVPLSVCEITTLKSLDLSDNREINYLPVEMGKLRNLGHINLKNLDLITDPPEQVRQVAEDLVTTLRTKLRNCEPYYTMKLMLVGKGGQGKTTLVHRLRDDFTFKENDLTQGVEISDLSIRRGTFYREFIFKVWDFGGQEDYYATHQCFLSTMSLYLLVWRLIDGKEGVQNLIPWLDNIAVRSPGSTVIIVGTHLDCITAEKYGDEYVTRMKERVHQLVEKPRYKGKVTVPPQGICAVSCAFGGSRAAINSLRLLIYDTAANLKKGRTPVMGELVPISFISLIQRIEKRKDEIQKGQLPIIRKEEFDAMVRENSLHCKKDIQEPMDVRDATVFLRERGVIMHFDDPNEGLSDLYFIDPRWLCALMARVITIRGHADLVKDGVLEIQETKTLFHSEDIPFDFYDQYLRLLVRFQVAYLLDASRVLVPSKLPEKEPEVVTNMQLPYAPVRRVYKIDYQRIHGFWPRFMSRFFFYVKEMIAVDATRYQKSKDGEHRFFGHFCRSCLRIDRCSTVRFSCFLDAAQWESASNSEGSRRTSRGTSDEDSSSSENTTDGKKSDPSKKGPARKDTTRKDPSPKGPSRKDTTRKETSREDPPRKDPPRKDPPRKDPSRKDSSRKDSSRKDSSKKKSTKKESWRKDPSVKVLTNGPSQVNAFSSNVSMPGPAMHSGNVGGNYDFHSLLLDPSVKLFSDDELQDDTDGQDRIVINNVDTAMNYTRRSESIHDKKNESVKRVAMDLRIPSFDSSQHDHRNRSRGLTRQNTTSSSAEEEIIETQRDRSSGEDDRPDKLSGEANSDDPKDADYAPTLTEDMLSTSKGIPNVFNVNPNTSEDVPSGNEDVPNVTADVLVENGKNATTSDHNPAGDEKHPIGNTERAKSDRNHSETIAAGNNITFQVIIQEDNLENDNDDVSEATDSEETKAVGIKIPTLGSKESCRSDENTSFLSCSDVCSLSSWKNSKGLPPSAAVSSPSPENASFSEIYNENMSESFGDSNAHLANASLPSDGSRASHNGCEFGINSASRNVCCTPVAGQQRTIAFEVEASYEVSQNSISQSGSPPSSSSIRSDEATDTDCEFFSESISSVSTTNDREPLRVNDHRPEEYFGTQFEPSSTLHDEKNPEALEEVGQVEEEETDVYNSATRSKLNDKTEIFTNSNGYNDTDEGIQGQPGDVNHGPTCDVISDVTDAATKRQLYSQTTTNEAKSEIQSDNIAEKLADGSLDYIDGVKSTSNDIIPPVHHHSVPQSSSSQSSATVANGSQQLPSPNMYVQSPPGASSKSVGATSENAGATSGNAGAQLENAGGPSKIVGEELDSDKSEPESVGMQSETPVVETKKCTLCKENVVVDQLVTIPLDVADLIERKFLHCWRDGVCFAHPEVFLLVSYRQLSDSIVVEIAVSPNYLGRRLLTFVVDHLDTLIKEWYPGLLLTFGAEPTVQKFIPCRTCEKDGKRKPTMLTFDSCVTQYSMGNFVKCFEHEVSIQDIAPDVVLQDIDTDLLLNEDELQYDRSDANLIGKGNFGKVYRGRCRERDAAIKEYSTATCEEDAMKRYCEVRNEVNILRRLGQHPFLVNLIGVCLRPFRLVLELAMEGSLAKTLFNPLFQIERVVVYRMLYQIADALSFLHSMNVIYRDLKPHNVLVMSYEETHDVNIKLTDFGTAAFQFNEGLISIEGTVGYLAPEMLKEFCKRTGYDDKVDLFSLGMVVYGFITRRKPFFNVSSSADVNSMVIAGRRPVYDDVMQARIGFAGLTWLMENCLSYEPNARHCGATVAEQLRSTPFQLFMGIIALPCQQSVRHVCLVQGTMELWVAVDDKAETTVFVYELKNWCLKKSFPIKRLSPDEAMLVLQVNCMHVNATEVLIGLRGDRDLVAIYDAKSYQLKAKITNLEEPVFSLSSNDSFIFLGMSTGVCLVTSTTKIVQSIEISHSEPVTCVTAVGNDFLWLAAGKCIQIFRAEGVDNTPPFELHAVRFSSSSAPFSQTVLCVDGSNVWCISKGDSVVTAWNVNNRQKTLEIDCKSILAQSLSEGCACDLLESAVTCVLPVLDTVWIGTGGGKLLIVDVTSGELITSMKLFDDHVRTLTLVPGPGPCGTEKYYVTVSGRKVLETALSRASQGKHVCRLNNDVIKPAPYMQTTPVKRVERSKSQSRRSPFRSRTPQSDTANSVVCDGAVNFVRGGALMFFEALPAKVLQRTESK